MLKDICGKKILFFSPAFFGYENKIVAKMRDMGAYVDMYDVRSVTSALERAILKISTCFYSKKSQVYYENIIEQNRNKDYDYILIVKCDMTPVSILKRFKEIYPKAKMCLYLWDSVDNIPGVENKFQYFDILHTFDIKDCKKYDCLKHRPLFYADEFSRPIHDINYKYDVCFTGTIHSDRYAIIKKVREIAKIRGLKCYWFFYLQSKFIYYFYKCLKPEFFDACVDDFSFEKKCSEEIADIVESSKTILDIQHPDQTGLTMRTIEMIGMNKKLITTNRSVMQYDFYNPNNICVIDRKNIALDENFINMDYIPIDNEVYEKYSLRRWILDILD